MESPISENAWFGGTIILGNTHISSLLATSTLSLPPWFPAEQGRSGGIATRCDSQLFWSHIFFRLKLETTLETYCFAPHFEMNQIQKKKYRKAFVNQQFWYWEYDEFLDGLGFECNLDLRVNWKLSLPTGSTAWGISKGASDTSLHIQAQDLLFKTIGYIFEITVGGFTYSNNKHVCSRFLPPHIWDVPPSDPWDPKMVVNLFQRYVTIQRSNGQR